jgi:hypothetical protein
LRPGEKSLRIYYVIDDTMMTQTVSMVPSLKVGAPEKLFKLRRTAYLQDVSLDGRFLLLCPWCAQVSIQSPYGPARLPRPNDDGPVDITALLEARVTLTEDAAQARIPGFKRVTPQT